MMSPEGSNYAYAEDVRVSNRLVKAVRAAALDELQVEIDPGDIETSIANIQEQLATPVEDAVRDKIISSGTVAIDTENLNILVDESLDVRISGGGIKGIVSATMTGVQGTFSTAYSAINTLTGGRLESVRSTIASKIQAAKSTVDSTLESIRSAFSSKLEAARSAVSGAIGRIKSCFNFSWSLPSLKLPHISISGSFSINPPSVPKFGISWYKDGGILNGATIFGAMGGKLLGGGEAGAEAVLPLSELWKQMTEIVRGVVKGENEESGDSVQQTGANITSALTSKAASVRKEKESKTTTKETYTTEKWGREGGTTIHQISFTVDISKIKDLPLLYKLIDDVDIMLDEDGQPVSDGNGDAALVSDEDCWLQDIKNEALTEEGELFYEDEEGDESYGWSLLDFMQGEYDDFMQMEIQQRIRSKLSKREYIDAGSIQTVVKFDGHVYRIRVSFRRNDSNRSYNIDIESDGVEVIVE